MILQKLWAEGFRNLTQQEMLFAPGVNLIYGNNAQGKTNLLEALWLFTGQKSFRQAKDREMVSFDQRGYKLSLSFFAKERDQTAGLVYLGKKETRLNGVKMGSAGELAGEITGVVFAPIHLGLVREGPELRRSFLDSAVFQLNPSYATIVREYDHILFQRNRLLKDLAQSVAGWEGTIDSYDTRLAELGRKIAGARQKYAGLLAVSAGEIYKGISSGERLDIAYRLSIDAEIGDYKAALKQALKKNLLDDIRNGFTSVGPHREDMELQINGRSARLYASQGQTKSAALCMKLAEGRILEAHTGEPPFFLLDDVMSELDPSRQDYILNNLGKHQLFITCCDPDHFKGLAAGRIFHMEDGKVRQTKAKG